MLGPALDVRGGVSRVEEISLRALAGRIPIRHVPTLREGSALRRLACYLSALARTTRELVGHRGTVVHIHFASRGSTLRKMVLASLALALGGRLLLHAHGGGFREFHAGLPSWTRRLLHRILSRSVRLIVLSESWGRFYVSECGVDAARVVVLLNPVVVPERVPVRAGRDEVRFLFLGRLSEAKGAFDLVRAFARLEPGVRQRARLALAGDGARAQLAGLVQDLRVGERVEVRGWVEPSERDALLEWADVYVLPSHREGVPMAMLEAMAAGLAVIGTPVGGVPEILDPGENGLSVEPGDLAALASAMTRLALEPGTRQRLGRAGRSTAVRHDAAHYAARLLETYRAVLGKEAPERPRGAASESRGGAR